MPVPPTAVTPEMRARVDALGARVNRLRRRVLEPAVLRGLMAVRLPPVRRAAQEPAARDRERRFLDASHAYARTGAGADDFGDRVRRIELDSLAWSVPLASPGDPAYVERALRHQDFPYRVITQTREVAVGGVMIDIGANIGRMSIPRVVLGDATAAYCAEADPLNYACLVRNARDNGLAGLVLPDHLVIGAADGTVRLERAKSTGGHRVIDWDAPSRRESIEVRSLTLDSWVRQLGIDLDQVRFVKMDVQGSEVDALRGAANVLAHKHIAWQIEVDLLALAARGVGRDDLYPLMQQHFTHFVDLNGQLTTARVRPVDELGEALAYVSGGTEGRTDVLLFTLQPAPLPV